MKSFLWRPILEVFREVLYMKYELLVPNNSRQRTALMGRR
jgi:hypothetical protein